MSDVRWFRRMIGFGLLGVAAMAVLVSGILLGRTTTSHDWYAAGKLTLIEAMLAVGFMSMGRRHTAPNMAIPGTSSVS